MLPVLFTSSSAYEIAKSLRFRASASAYLSRTFSTPTDNKKWTWSGWRKRGLITSDRAFFGAGASNPNAIYFDATDSLAIDGYYNGTRALRYSANKFRDPSAWYHIVVAFDSTQATDSNRLKVWVNGDSVALSGAVVGTWPALNSSSVINSAVIHAIGRRNNVTDMYYDGYMAEDNFIDGQALDPSYFGKTDFVSGQWVPKKYTGSYGANGFYLDYKDGTSLTTLGYDKSGNGNNWTLNNFSLTAGVTYDWMDDTPTNNYATLNLLNTAGVSNGSLTLTGSGVPDNGSTIWVATGKWYAETLASAIASTGRSFGVRNLTGTRFGIYQGYDGQKSLDATVSTYGATWGVNNVIGLAFDIDNNTLEFFKDGVSQGSISYTMAGDTWSFRNGRNGTADADTVHYNFGQRPFAYTPPTGFKALCTKNLTSDDVIESGTFTGNANADGPFVWCNGTPETLTINGNAVTWGTHADRLANGFKLRTSSTSYNAAGSNNWTATTLSPERKSAFRNQRAKGNP